MKNMYSILLALGLMSLASQELPAQDAGFIYGKVTTDDNRVYEGPIRWGKEEVYWVDVFNASKEENDNLKYLSRDEKYALDEKKSWRNGEFVSSSTLRWLGIGSSDNYYYERDFTHQFSCQFGEIKSLRPFSRERVEVELQSGLKFEVDGEGYNDVGAKVKVLDEEIGEVEINWSNIDMIEFKSIPSKVVRKFGEALYGAVETYQGTYTGYIQWDHDERISTDKLDGESEDGKVSIAFEKIKSIERYMSRCRVVLKSGRELELRGSNDVNSENRGIIITNENGVIVDVPWDEFKKLNVMDAPSKSIKRYEDFKSQKEINATVIATDGKSFSGRIILDLDEAYDFELFQGKDGDVEYATPMRNIKKITVKSRHSVNVELRNGNKLSLEDSQDSGELNQGVLVFSSKNEVVYIPWEDVSEIQLN